MRELLALLKLWTMNSYQEIEHEEEASPSISTPMYMTPSVIKMVKQESNSDSSSQEEEQCEPVLGDERKDHKISEDELEGSTYEVSSRENIATTESNEPQEFNEIVVNHSIRRKRNRKSFSTRNAWGNFSYSDLITRAIMSSPDERMTLQEIYAWISDNIPYFMDKRDDPTTTGWKNSVRHTLSIRKRFIRLPNVAFGSLNYKSLWTIDPYAEARRRNPSRQPVSNQAESPRLEAANWNQQLRVWTSQPLDRATQTEFSNTWCPYCRHLVSLNCTTGNPFAQDVSGYQN